jgi:hypothetical protein
MIRRRREQRTTTTVAPAFADFHEWVLSLPWVVERPYSPGAPGVRSFAVDCEPLERRQLWLITGLQRELDAEGIGLGIIVPVDVARELEYIGRGRIVAPMPARHVLVTVHADCLPDRQDLELLVLTAYGCAMS